jgi:acyl-CoA thioester hydrolase
MSDDRENPPAETAGFDLSDPNSYKFWSTDILRWGDTDGLGHINNVQFMRFCESGRIAYLGACGSGVTLPADDFMIAHMTIDFRAQMHFPGEVKVGTRLIRIGNTSARVGQGLFQNGICTATAEEVMVRMDPVSQRPTPIPDDLRERLANPPV